MASLFDRLGSAFVAPPADVARRAAADDDQPRTSRPPRPRRPERPASRSVALLCRPEDALVAAGAVALGLAGKARTSHALVVGWRAGAVAVRAPAAAGARRLAATLAARGHETAATGRLAVVAGAGPLAEAAPEAARALAASSGVPAVVALAGPRDPAAEALLRAQDAVIVARPPGGDAAVTELTLLGLAALDVAALTLDLPPAPAPARALAASGVAVVPPLRAAVDAVTRLVEERAR